MCNETQQFKIGQKVKILNGINCAIPYIGQCGQIDGIVEYGERPYQVKFNDGVVWRFGRTEIEMVIEQPSTSPRPKVGQKVLILRSSFDNDASDRISTVGTLIKDDNSKVPYEVKFNDGDTNWFREHDISLPDKQNHVFSTLKPGMRVKSSRNGWLIVVPSAMVKQDSDSDFMLWATGGCCSDREHILDELKHVEAVYQAPSNHFDVFNPSKHGDKVWEVSQWVDPEEIEKQQKREGIMKQIQDLQNQLMQIK